MANRDGDCNETRDETPDIEALPQKRLKTCFSQPIFTRFQNTG